MQSLERMVFPVCISDGQIQWHSLKIISKKIKHRVPAKKKVQQKQKKDGEFLTQHLCNAGEAEFTTLLFWTFGGYKE